MDDVGEFASRPDARARFCCEPDFNQGRRCCHHVAAPHGSIGSRELRWIVVALIVFWVVLIFGVPALLGWLLPRLAA